MPNNIDETTEERVPATLPDARMPMAGGAAALAETRRAIAEVQSAMLIAKQFPRDRTRALDQIMRDCGRKRLAEEALYSYSRGGSEITGPSIRLAEVLAQNWGNIEFGWNEVARSQGISEVIAFAWDTETNVRRSIKFHVKHLRDTKGGPKPVRDERDIYEICANQAARRMRACILNIIPGDIVDEAVEVCEATLAAKETTTPEAIAKMVEVFAALGVSKEKIERRCQRKAETITAPQMIQLRRIYNSIKDGMSSPDEWFEGAPASERPQRPIETPKEEKPKEEPYTIIGWDGQERQALGVEAAVAAFTAALQEGGKGRGTDGVDGVWESNGLLFSQLRERGNGVVADGLQAVYSAVILEVREAASPKKAEPKAPAKPEASAEAAKPAAETKPDAPKAEAAKAPAKKDAPKSPLRGGDWPTFVAWMKEQLRAMPAAEMQGFLKEKHGKEWAIIVESRVPDFDAISQILDERTN